MALSQHLPHVFLLFAVFVTAIKSVISSLSLGSSVRAVIPPPHSIPSYWWVSPVVGQTIGTPRLGCLMSILTLICICHSTVQALLLRYICFWLNVSDPNWLSGRFMWFASTGRLVIVFILLTIQNDSHVDVNAFVPVNGGNKEHTVVSVSEILGDGWCWHHSLFQTVGCCVFFFSIASMCAALSTVVLSTKFQLSAEYI